MRTRAIGWGLITIAVAVGVGLRIGTGWTRKGAYAVIGWFTLVPVSVGAMAVTMQIRHDPEASLSSSVVLSVVAVVFLTVAVWIYRPLIVVPESPDPPAGDLEPLPSTGIDLYWLPLGAGGHSVRWNGRVYEALAAVHEHRTGKSLYHAALEVRHRGTRYVIEMGPVWNVADADRGIVCEGPVGSRRLGRFRWFRYEVRCWRDGVLSDRDEAIDSPIRLSDDAGEVVALIDALWRVPSLTWGRDELGAGEMWNSNSVVAWLLSTAGQDMTAIHPPNRGRAPGWGAGLTLAATSELFTGTAEPCLASTTGRPQVGHGRARA